MRRLVDGLIVLMLAAVVGGLLWHYQQERARLDRFQQVHESLRRLYEQALFQGSLDRNSTNAGFPKSISRSWFTADLPVNAMVPSEQPWIDIAPPGDKSDHPPDPVITSRGQAGFWYNPNRGLFRARVLPGITEQETLDLYNQLNNTVLKTLPYDRRPQRRPQSLDAIASSHDDAPVVDADADGSSTRAPAPRRRTLNDVSIRK
jgi:hypothetical protein